LPGRRREREKDSGESLTFTAYGITFNITYEIVNYDFLMQNSRLKKKQNLPSFGKVNSAKKKVFFSLLKAIFLVLKKVLYVFCPLKYT